jgi:peptidoglycan/xylan/chitin deacetylase (PgdA/CDA1 family)
MALFWRTTLICCVSLCGLFVPAKTPVAAPSRPPSVLCQFQYDHHAVVRGDTSRTEWSLIFTGGDFNDGGLVIRNVLAHKRIHAGFFFTGDFYRNPENRELIRQLARDGHYLGPHSDKHLLYCSWSRRDSTLVSREQFCEDLRQNYRVMAESGIVFPVRVFIPPYEWFNEQQVAWSAELGITLFNFTPGIGTPADYTTPEMSSYKSSSQLEQHLLNFERQDPAGLRGAIVLIHIGTHPARTDKFYSRLGDILDRLEVMGYRAIRIDSLLTRP